MSEIASNVNKQRLKIKTKVNPLLPRPFLCIYVNVYSKEFHSHIWEHLQIQSELLGQFRLIGDRASDVSGGRICLTQIAYSEM